MRFSPQLTSEVFPRGSFWETFGELSESVEEKISGKLNSSKIENTLIFEVLRDQGWGDWSNNIDKLVKCLVPLIIALYCDKISISLLKSENIDSLVKLLGNIAFKTDDDESILERSIFSQKMIQFLDDLSINESEYPITSKTDFPLNKILNILFINQKDCILCAKLAYELLTPPKPLSLILPFLYEAGIPTKLQQTQGQVFTPLEIVKFLVSYSLSKENFTRIIDPACGSGLFLIETLRFCVNSPERVRVKEIVGIEKNTHLRMVTQSGINYFLSQNPNLSIKSSIIGQDLFLLTENEIKLIKSQEKTLYLVNPPYTRQEHISKSYKAKIQAIIQNNFKLDLKRIKKSNNLFSGRSGMYVYFLFWIAQNLNLNDAMGLIIPNSWLDVDYGYHIRELLHSHFHIHTLIQTTKEKLIPSVEVNTVILYLIRNPMNESMQLNYYLIEERKDLLKIISHNIEDENSPKVIKQTYFSPQRKWSMILRSSNEMLNVINKLNTHLIPLKDVADVKRGFTTGANDFFYLGKPGCDNKFFRSEWNPLTGDLFLYIKNKRVEEQFIEQGWTTKTPMFRIEKEYWMHIKKRNLSENDSLYFVDSKNQVWVPNYIVKSPKVLKEFEINESNINYVVLIVRYNLKFFKNGLKDYIHWGESWVPSSGQKYSLRPTCKVRTQWFSLPELKKDFYPLLGMMTINDRFTFFYNSSEYYFDARFYGIQIKPHINEKFTFLFLYLNSILVMIQLELLGRINLGEGGLDIKVYEYKEIRVPSFDMIDLNQQLAILTKFKTKKNQQPPSIHEISLEEEYEILNLFPINFQLNKRLLESLKTELEALVQKRIEKAR